MGQWALAAVIGFVSGVLSGAFGIGGGIVTTPAIRLLLGAPALIAVGTPLPVIIPSAITGALSYRRKGLADVRAGLILGASGAATAVAGAILATRIGGTVVLIGTAALILYAAGDTILQVVQERRRKAAADSAAAAAQGGQAGQGKPTALAAQPALAVGPLVGVGALTGLYSGFFGLGGGFVLVPMLTRWMRLDIKRAIGTSLVTVGILAVPGTITHAVLGNIDWAITAGLVLGVIPGAMVGARITQATSDTRIRVAFAVLLVVVGLWLAASELGPVLW
jgi:hypothetical protein